MSEHSTLGLRLYGSSSSPPAPLRSGPPAPASSSSLDSINWAKAAEKVTIDSWFARLDRQNKGSIEGDVAADFRFGNQVLIHSTVPHSKEACWRRRSQCPASGLGSTISKCRSSCFVPNYRSPCARSHIHLDVGSTVDNAIRNPRTHFRDEDVYHAVDPFKASVAYYAKPLRRRTERYPSLMTTDSPLPEVKTEFDIAPAQSIQKLLWPEPTAFTYAWVFLTRTLPSQIYFHIMLRLPGMYWSRVARIFEEAEISLPDIAKMIIELGIQRRWDATKYPSFG